MPRSLLLAACLTLAVAPSGAQQRPVGSLHGVVREKIGSRSARAAWVSLLHLDSSAGPTRSVQPDAHGSYRVDSLPAGRYLVQVSSPTLDSLELALPAERVEIAPGRASRFDYTLPSGPGLRDAVCQGLRLGSGKVVVAGRALNADTEKPLAGAEVAAAWLLSYVDRTTQKVATQTRRVSVKAGSSGEYRLCGVPSDTTLSLQLLYEGRAGAIVRVTASDHEGAVVRDLSLSPRTAATISALDSVGRLLTTNRRDSTRGELKLAGTATITGQVRSLAGAPVAEAVVRVRDAHATTTTDSAGRYTLDGMPPGTQLLLVRKAGYPVAQVVVELRPDRSVARDVLLRRNVVSDSIDVLHRRNVSEEFERNRRAHPFGQFIEAEEIDQMKVTEAADLFINVLGFSVFGKGAASRIVSNAALSRRTDCRQAIIEVNGVEGGTIDALVPGNIGGIEAYADDAFVPARFEGRAKCGVIVIWPRKHIGPAPRPPVLRADGYQ